MPNGYAGKKPELLEIRRNTQRKAERLMDEVICKGRFVPDCLEARIAMTAALAIVANPSVHLADRLRAVRTILTFTVPRRPPAPSSVA